MTLLGRDDSMRNNNNPTKQWIRGVNIGGWLVLERYITPYMFAITECHLQGNFCWYPQQLSAPAKNAPTCDRSQCPPVRFPNVFGQLDFPLDEYHLGLAFINRTDILEEWLEYHFDNFVTMSDLLHIRQAGLTHIRVPLPHWIFGAEEPPHYVAGTMRWKYFVRLCHWARQVGLQVWPDIHTAPGSQNGFDNSGRQKSPVTCDGWWKVPSHVETSLQVLRNFTRAILHDGLDGVITGLGLLNEPFVDCDEGVYRRFLNDGRNIVRDALGEQVYIYVSDMFRSERFNDGSWWLDPVVNNNTLLDSHYYHVFEEQYRGLSPRQHIALACVKTAKQVGVNNCCYEDAPRKKSLPSRGVQRLVSEWSLAFDTLPVDMLKVVMNGIADDGVAPYLDRTMSKGRKEFLNNFAQAQMVAYEAADSGMVHGNFFWNFKMEGGAFAEWDWLRGVKEGWIPPIPAVNVSSEEAYGDCYDILFRTNDTMDIIHEFPLPDDSPRYWSFDDDVVVTHGDSLLPNYKASGHHPLSRHINWIILFLSVLLAVFLYRTLRKRDRKGEYTRIDSDAVSIVL